MPSEGTAESTPGQRVSQPTGTLTFLFSDIEGSTQRWEAKRESMQRALPRHEELMRSAILRHNGYIFKTVGDAFCCAFATAPSALRAALDAQLAHATEDFSDVDDLRVRIGLHTGYAHERDGDYFGPAVNRVARLMAIGHGGQVLLSRAAYDLVQNDAPPGTTFTDLGSHQLKDLAQPERVWQATTAGMLSDFPEPRSLAAFPNNLPVQVTGFFGRERDIQELKLQLSEHHLVTLLGAGGVGKTRLAVHAGADLLDHFLDGVWVADFAPISDPQSVPSVVARALSVSQAQGRLFDDSIAQWLRHKQLLLILDNCEHLIEAVAQLADSICRSAPDVRVLATSRQALGISGEKALRLASLAVPVRAGDLAPNAAIQFGAVALFVDRAALVDQTFRLHDHNAPIVVDICRRLDGIPLAIELAAARVKMMSVASLAQRLNERFKILTGGSRTALPRQKTLAALIDWSYDLLAEQEQSMFNRAAIFAGSFTLDAATHVCAGDGLHDDDVIDLMCSLADKSLVVIDTDEDEERYQLLESTRQYGLKKLAASGECERLEQRYAGHYMELAGRFDRSLSTMELSTWLATVERELDNCRAVLEWALGDQNDANLGGSLAASLEMFWWHAGIEAEGRRWIEASLNQVDANAKADITSRLEQAQARLTSRMLFS
jgi:predicted ATPase/class 3 adenylate cyclase